MTVNQVYTVVIGGGQAGLAVGYYLTRHHRDFVILDAHPRIGDAWRHRWESLRLFTPAGFDGLPGLPFPAPENYLPTKDEMAEYLEEYATTFRLPVRLGCRVTAVHPSKGGFLVQSTLGDYVAEHVVVATGPYHTPSVPAFAGQLDAAITQMHSSAYRTPSALPPGAVLVVGAGNSGAEIAVEIAATRRTYLSGRDTGFIAGGIQGPTLPRFAYFGWRLGWRLIGRMTVNTPWGRKAKEHDRKRGTPLIRLTRRDLLRSGVMRVPRTAGAQGGRPVLADGRVLDVAAVIWATGYRPDYSWIDLDIFDADGYPAHTRGVVGAAPGLYFLGLPFQHTALSAVVGGVGPDAQYVADHIMGCQSPR